MSPGNWIKIKRACAGALAVVGVVGLVAVLILSSTITSQLRELDPLQKGMAKTLVSTAKTTQELAKGLEEVEPVVGNVQPLMANADEVLAHVDSTLRETEAGLKDAQPLLTAVAKVAEKDVPELLGVGSKTIGAGEAVLGEVRGGLREVSRNTNKVEIQVMDNRVQLGKTMTATRQELARYRPLVVTAPDINAVCDYLDSLDLPISTDPLRDHARYLEQNKLEYRADPNETYQISPASLRQLAEALDTTGLALDTNALRRQAEEMERQGGLVVRFGLDPALATAEANVETGVDIAVSYTRGVRVASGAADKSLDQIQGQLVVVQGFLKRLESEAPGFATGARTAHKLTVTTGQDLAAIRASVADARGRIKETTGTAVPAVRKMLGTSRENLVSVGENLKANAAAVESLQLSQTAIQIVSWITWIAALFFLGLALIGGYWFASTFKEGETAPIS